MSFFFADLRSVGRFRQIFDRRRATVACAAVLAIAGSAAIAESQALDCGRLQAQIAQQDHGGNRYAQAARRQSGDLARTQAYAHQLGCDAFSFFGGNPQCPGINARVSQMQANLSALQSAGGGGNRGDLVARYNAYCRGGQPAQPQRGFFESLFGGFQQQQPAPPSSQPPPTPAPEGDFGEDGTFHARGGSQAVCVRTCDGGFFPLSISARHSNEDLTEMCQALCPGTDTAVYTRNPDHDIKTSLGIDGKPYMDLPNALHFTKNFTPACSCRQPGKSWAETLANAEEVLDATRKGDIVVTPEKSAELSRPKEAIPALGKPPQSGPKASSDVGQPMDTTKAQADAGQAQSGARRTVRQVGPQP